MAACLWARIGSVVSHRSAAALLDLPGGDRGIVEISSARRVRNPKVIVHSCAMSDEEIGGIGPIPMTSPLRTLADLGVASAQSTVNDAVDDALRKRLVTLAELRGYAEETEGNQRGIARFRRALHDLDVRMMLTESVFEGRLFRVLKRAGLPLPIPQYAIRHEGRFVARVDFAYPQARLAIEAESYRWHGNVSRNRHDHNVERLNRLSEIDWTVLAISWRQLDDHPEVLVGRVRRHLRPTLYG